MEPPQIPFTYDSKSPNLDSFGRLRVSSPTGLFDSQFTYSLQPLIFEQITAQTGATIAHDATNRNALMTFASTPTGGKAIMQTFSTFRYQPGKSQLVRVTFQFVEPKANVIKFAGISDGVNGIEFQNNGTVNQFVVYSGTAVGNQTVTQANWNLDKLDGSGGKSAQGGNPSGVILDITKANHVEIDFQALYVGRVRVGFDIGGKVIYVHEFLFSNNQANQYIQSVNLPIRCGMTCTGTVSTTMCFICSAVISEGGQEIVHGYEFAQEGAVTAASGVRTHLLSIRPKTTFNGIVNRSAIGFIEVDLIVTGANPVLWELCLGQAISGTTAFNDINTTYSSTEYNILGTASGNPAIVFDTGYVSATVQSRGSTTMVLTHKYPITLDAAGAQRLLGTITLLATGIGGASACRAAVKFIEIR